MAEIPPVQAGGDKVADEKKPPFERWFFSTANTWCRWPESNWRPSHYECAALPTELQRRRPTFYKQCTKFASVNANFFAFFSRPGCGPLKSMEKCGFLLRVVSRDAGHFVFRAKEDGHALMQLVRGDVHDALLAIGGRAAGLFDDEGHRVRFVHQAQLARH